MAPLRALRTPQNEAFERAPAQRLRISPIHQAAEFSLSAARRRRHQKPTKKSCDI